LVLVLLKIHVFEERFALKGLLSLVGNLLAFQKNAIMLDLEAHRQSPANSTKKFYCAYFDIYSEECRFLKKEK
jgi:hypothetical protein